MTRLDERAIIPLGMLRAATVLVVMGLTTPALAQEGSSEPGPDVVARADAAFHDAKRLLDEERIEEACAKFEASQSLAPGSGTLLNLGDCYERLGRTASAWATFRAAAALARSKNKAERAEEGVARAAALERRLSKVRIVVPDDVRGTPGLVVQRGDVEVDPTRFGAATPVDPGLVVVRADAPGYAGWSTTLTIPKTPGVVNVEVPALRLQTPEPAPAPAPAPGRAPEPPPPPTANHPGLVQQIVGGALGGLGLVAVGVGTYFGVRALRIEEDSNREDFCNQDDFCTNDGLELRDDALSHAHASTGLIFGGAAVAITGLVVFLTAPSAGDEAPVEVGLSPLPGGAYLETAISW